MEISTPSLFCCNSFTLLPNNYSIIFQVEDKQLDTLSSVVNSSSLTLTPAQCSVLEKGLSFCPIPGPSNLCTCRTDLDRFNRNLKLWCYFHQEETQTSPDDNSSNIVNITMQEETDTFSHRKFTPKSTWTPSGPTCLEATC